MKILSLAEDQSLASEADELCRVAEIRGGQLQEMECGSGLTLDGRVYRCISSDKNRIFRVTGKHHWYLKFSLQEEWIRHEIAGAEAIRKTLAGFEGYLHAGAIRASIEGRYTLYSAIDGRDFNSVLLYRGLTGLAGLGAGAGPAMYNLGRSLARFHSYNGGGDMKALNPDTLSYLGEYLHRIRQPGPLEERIADWVARQRSEDTGVAWIHGNIKSEDILIANDRVCLIDLGTCGIGAPGEDLAGLCTYLMLFRAVPAFPWRIARQAMSALLQGYTQESGINTSCLYSYITRGICRYYLKNMVLHGGIASISGMPVLKRRIERMIAQLLEEDYETALAGAGSHVPC